MKKIPQLEPYLGEEEIKNVTKAIKDNWITEGPFSKKFLEQIKKFTKSKYAVLTNNGSIALFLGLKALGIKEGDEVILPDFSFIASATSIIFAGAKPVFVDILDTNLNINPSLIEKAITKKTKAIMVIHLYGQSANMDPIMKIAKKHNLKVIEDAAQGYGVFYKGKDGKKKRKKRGREHHVGTMGDVGTISFFADKTITTGEGAVVLTNNKKIYEKLMYLRNQGRLKSGNFFSPELGLNFRMTDLQCAVGVAQVKKFKEIKKIKLKNYNLYKKLLKNEKNIEFIKEESYSNIVPFRVNILVKHSKILFKFLEKNGIMTRGFFYPLHKQGPIKKAGYEYNEEDFPVTLNVFHNGLSLPVFCNLKESQIKYICDKIKEFYRMFKQR